MRSNSLKLLATALLSSVVIGLVGCPKAPEEAPPSSNRHPAGAVVAATAQGRALCIGLNRVDPEKWAGWDGKLKGCLNDVAAMKSLLIGRGFRVSTLTDAQATTKAVLDEVIRLGGECKSGDLFVITYSGHGGQLPDENGDEADRLDETWCLYDGHLIDDYLMGALAKIPEGVRVVVISDSCHSGTVIRMTQDEMVNRIPPDAKVRAEAATLTRQLSLWEENAKKDAGHDKERPLSRGIPLEAAWKAYSSRRDFYDKLGKDAPAKDGQVAKASILLISGCQDGETSMDGKKNGLFTECLLEVWNEGKFTGSYADFHAKIQAMTNERRLKIPPFDETQKPNFMIDGAGDPQFPNKQAPFLIAPKP